MRRERIGIMWINLILLFVFALAVVGIVRGILLDAPSRKLDSIIRKRMKRESKQAIQEHIDRERKRLQDMA